MRLSAERARRLESIFDEAADLDLEARPAYLDQACAGDSLLRREVEALLAAFDTHAGDVRQLFEGLPLPALPAEAPPHAHDPHQLIGRRVAHYQILETIGGGGMGVVYRARDLQLDRTVALKFLPLHLGADEQAKERFIREAKAASALNHTNICTIHGIGETEQGQLYIVMACYEGETLKKHIGRSPLPVGVALDYAIQTARGLEKAHAAGIVHRDVKPANLLVTTDGVVKILDFGIAKVTGVDLTRTGVIQGTVAYMSPEQVRGRSVDHRTDLWSLGVVLYELLTGRRPFQGTPDTIIYAIRHDNPEPVTALRSGLPPMLEHVVSRALSKDPDERHQHASELLADLAHGRAPESESPRWSLAKRLVRNRGYRYGAALVLILVALSAGGRYWFGPDGSSEPEVASIAVLPLQDLSPGGEQEYFVAGMHDALIDALAQVGALRVISRTSMRGYENSNQSVPEIARELNVDRLIEASLYREGDSVRIQVRLIQALPEEQYVWTGTFSRELERVPALHSDVAQAIARQIQVRLSPEEATRLASTRPVRPQAYEAYLRGRFYLYKLSLEHYETALQYFESALRIDPDYAPAHAGVASVWMHRGLWGGVPPLEAFEKARRAAEHALRLDPTLAETHMVLGTGAYCYEWDWEAAEAALLKAIELNPNHTEARAYLADLLVSTGRPDRAVTQVERAVQLDPLNPFTQTLQGWVLFGSRRYDEAVVQLQEALEIEPENQLALRCLWSIYHLQGRREEAMAMARRFYEVQDFDEVAEALGQGQSAAGHRAAYGLAADRLAARAERTYVPAMRVARLYTFGGDREAALDYLERAYEERFPSMSAIGADPHWDALRDHPRFRALMERMQL